MAFVTSALPSKSENWAVIPSAPDRLGPRGRRDREQSSKRPSREPCRDHHAAPLYDRCFSEVRCGNVQPALLQIRVAFQLLTLAESRRGPGRPRLSRRRGGQGPRRQRPARVPEGRRGGVDSHHPLGGQCQAGHSSPDREGRPMAGATSGTVAVLVFVSLFSPPAPVPAYDRGDCQRIFPQGTVLHDVDSLRIDTGNYYEVDFGDELHLLGSPQGNAVICWQQGRHGVAVIGRLYVDPRTSSSQHCVKIELDV